MDVQPIIVLTGVGFWMMTVYYVQESTVSIDDEVATVAAKRRKKSTAHRRLSSIISVSLSESMLCYSRSGDSCSFLFSALESHLSSSRGAAVFAPCSVVHCAFRAYNVPVLYGV